MGSLKDELIKAKLVSKKELKKIEHEERIKRKEVGGEKGLEEERRKKQEEIKAKEETKRALQKELDIKKREEKEKEDIKYRIRDIILSNCIREGLRGTRKFYFVTREGKIPFLEVTDEIGRKLENGDLAIVEIPGGSFEEFAVLTRDKAKEIIKLDPDLVRFLNKM